MPLKARSIVFAPVGRDPLTAERQAAPRGCGDDGGRLSPSLSDARTARWARACTSIEQLFASARLAVAVGVSCVRASPSTRVSTFASFRRYRHVVRFAIVFSSAFFFLNFISPSFHFQRVFFGFLLLLFKFSDFNFVFSSRRDFSSGDGVIFFRTVFTTFENAWSL